MHYRTSWRAKLNNWPWLRKNLPFKAIWSPCPKDAKIWLRRSWPDLPSVTSSYPKRCRTILHHSKTRCSFAQMLSTNLGRTSSQSSKRVSANWLNSCKWIKTVSMRQLWAFNRKRASMISKSHLVARNFSIVRWSRLLSQWSGKHRAINCKTFTICLSVRIWSYVRISNSKSSKLRPRWLLSRGCPRYLGPEDSFLSLKKWWRANLSPSSNHKTVRQASDFWLTLWKSNMWAISPCNSNWWVLQTRKQTSRIGR